MSCHILPDPETVFHPAETKDARKIEAFHVRTDGGCAGRDDQFVIGQLDNTPILAPDLDGFRTRIDRLRVVIEQQPDRRPFDLIDRPMSECSPVLDLSAQKEGKTADAVVWKLIRYHHSHPNGRLHLPGAKAR